MNAHYVIFPACSLVGVGAIVALNVVAVELGPRDATSVHDCAPTPASQRDEAQPPAQSPHPTPSSAAPAGAAPAGAASADVAPADVAPAEAASNASPEGSSDGAALPPAGAMLLPFGARSALFEAEARSQMFKIAREMKEIPARKLKLVGHSDRRTDGEQAEGLGARRVQGAYDFIVQLGIEPQRISHETQPPTTSPDAAASPAHRAVHALWQ